MRIFATILIFMLALSPAQAAEIYVKKNKDSALPPAIGTVPPATSAPQTLTPAAPVAPDDMKTFAENYYKNCTAKTNPMLDADSQKKLCACSAGRLMQTMTIDEVKAMQENNPQGQLYRNKMLLQVYTPCIEFPAYALVNTSCVNNAQVKAFPGYQGICDCASSKMATYVRENAPATIENALRQNPGDLDPLRAMLESEGFNQASNAALQACLLGKTR